MSPAPAKEFRWYEGLAFCLAAVGNQLSSEFIAQWGNYFYSPTEGGGRIIYVAIGAVVWMFFVGRIFDAVIDPLVGVWTDQTRSKPGIVRVIPISGRRRPFMFWGSIFMTVTGIAYWFPPFAHTTSLNLLYGTVVLCLHFFFFTLCIVPMLALGPEIARSELSRMKLGTWIAVGMVIGLAIGDALPGQLIALFDPARHAGESGAFSPVGYQRVGILFALVSLATFQFLVWAVKERAVFEKNETRRKVSTVFGDMYGTLRNRPFVVYIVASFLFSIGLLASQRALPNWAEVALGGGEEMVTRMLLPFIGTALCTAFFLMPLLRRRVSAKWLLVASFAIMGACLPLTYPISLLSLSSETKLILGGMVFGVCGIGQGMQYVLATPIIGEIIDFDEQYTGQRREGAYNGMYFVGVKAGTALSVVLSNVIMHRFGNSVAHPLGILLVGPAAGFVALLGLLVILKYPVLNVAQKVMPESITAAP